MNMMSQSQPSASLCVSDRAALHSKLRQLKSPLFLFKREKGTELLEASACRGEHVLPDGMVLPAEIDALGDSSFCRDHGLRYAYVGGSMAKGISSVAMVKALGQEGMLGFSVQPG